MKRTPKQAEYEPSNEKANVIILYRKTALGKFAPAGSGVLATYGNRQFLLTAGHVVGREKTHSIWIGGGSLVAVDGVFKRNVIADEFDSETDPIDFAALELKRYQVELLLANCAFISLDLDTPTRRAISSSRCLISGFLERDNQTTETSLPRNALRVEVKMRDQLLAYQTQMKPFKDCLLAGVTERSSGSSKIKEGFQGMSAADFCGLSGGLWLYEDAFWPGRFSEFAGITTSVKPRKRGRDIVFLD